MADNAAQAEPAETEANPVEDSQAPVNDEGTQGADENQEGVGENLQEEAGQSQEEAVDTAESGQPEKVADQPVETLAESNQDVAKDTDNVEEQDAENVEVENVESGEKPADVELVESGEQPMVESTETADVKNKESDQMADTAIQESENQETETQEAGAENLDNVEEGVAQETIAETEAPPGGEELKTEEVAGGGYAVEQDVGPVEEVQVTGEEETKENVGTATEPNVATEEVDPHAVSPQPPVSPRSFVNTHATATVKFVLMPSGQVATLACQLSQTLLELKEHFSHELKMPASAILLMFDGKATADMMTLGELGVGPNGTVQLEMQSADPVNTPMKAYRPRQEYQMPDVITVRVMDGHSEYRDVVVEIERATRKKPFLGGYRHKKTNAEYHHASAQTMQKVRAPTNVPRFCRDTQTVQQRHQVQQTFSDSSTQMTKVGLYVSNMEDKLMVPGQYTTAEEYHAMILKKVIIIQKYYRRWLAKRVVEHVRKDKAMRLEWERQEEIRKKKEKEDRIRREFERRMNPKTKQDFDLLYHALEKWRQEELDKINQSLTGAERKAALCQLLEQETQLIASIGRHKIEAENENKGSNVQSFLEKAAAPKKWKGPDGNTTEMDTPYTVRARELMEIYNSINMKYLTQDERLDVLLTLKHTVKEHDCKLTQEIIELIDREADLLMRGVKEGNLDGLRKRISTLFLQYIKTPTFNPEAARLLKVPQDASKLRKNIYFCASCNKYLPSTEFALSSNSRTVGKCRSCLKLDNDARGRQDLSTYRYMLKALRLSEQAFGDDSQIAFLLQETDLRYLVENVWNSQSALSAWDDLYDLVLVRWDKHVEWSPWNCVLLTKEEASAHAKLEQVDEGYGEVFIQKCVHRHTLARNYFSRLPGMAEHMRKKINDKNMKNGPTVQGQSVPQARVSAVS